MSDGFGSTTTWVEPLWLYEIVVEPLWLDDALGRANLVRVSPTSCVNHF